MSRARYVLASLAAATVLSVIALVALLSTPRVLPSHFLDSPDNALCGDGESAYDSIFFIKDMLGALTALGPDPDALPTNPVDMGDVANCVPINPESFPCTADGKNPLTRNFFRPNEYTPCCPGSRVVWKGFWTGYKCQADPVPPPGTPYTLECVRTDAVPPCRRCDLTSTAGASSCPLARMDAGERYLVYPGGASTCIFEPTLTGIGNCSGSDNAFQSNRYSFNVVKKDPKKLMVYFQGGGACWDKSVTVGKFAGGLISLPAPTCTSTAVPNDMGIPDQTVADNRYANFTQVQLSYCSGDVFVSNTTQSYSAPKWPSMPVKQKGYSNAMATLQWMLSQPEFAELDELVIAGASAGSVGVQTWTKQILETLGSRAKTSATIYDSFTGVFPAGTNYFTKKRFSASGYLMRNNFQVCDLPGLLTPEQRAVCEDGQIELDMITRDNVATFGDTTFTQVQSKQDLIQRLFYDMVAITLAGYLLPTNYTKDVVVTEGGKTYFYNKSLEWIQEYRAAAVRPGKTSNYFAAIVDGDCHVFSLYPDWYTANAGGPGPERAQCPNATCGIALAEQEIKIYGSVAGAAKCCGHPGRSGVVDGPELNAYMKLADWGSLPLVPPEDAKPFAVPPLWAQTLDTCFGPLEEAEKGSPNALYSCPAFLDYVTGGVITP